MRKPVFNASILSISLVKVVEKGQTAEYLNARIRGFDGALYDLNVSLPTFLSQFDGFDLLALKKAINRELVYRAKVGERNKAKGVVNV
jgi:hypothetical protein